MLRVGPFATASTAERQAAASNLPRIGDAGVIGSVAAVNANDREARGGPVFVVDSLADFHDKRPESLTVVQEPSEIPAGLQAIYSEPGGAILYGIDQSVDGAAGERSTCRAG